jgi:hypothetical protein
VGLMYYCISNGLEFFGLVELKQFVLVDFKKLLD